MAARSISTSRRFERLEVLYKISNITNTTLEPRRVLRAILREAVRITGATSGSIAMVDWRHGVLSIETAINIPPRTWKKLKLQLGVGVTGWVAYKGEPVRVDDVRRDAHYVAVKANIRSELAVPVFLHGQVIGVINVDSERRAAFTDDDERLLTAVAEQSARVIETARLHNQVREHARQAESLLELGSQLLADAPLGEVLEFAVLRGRTLSGMALCALFDVGVDGSALSVRAVAGGRERSWLGAPAVPLDGSLLQPVVSEGRPVVHEDLRPRALPVLGVLEGANEYQSLLAVPVVAQERVAGILAFFGDKPRTLAETDVRLAELLANQCALAIGNARRRDRLLAMEDSLHRAERFSLLGTLAAEIAHEIRNPVTIINLLLDTISEQLDEESQARSDMHIVRTKIDRIERIVEQTLSMARSREPELELLDVSELLADIEMFLRHKLAKAGVSARVLNGEGLPPVRADRGQMQQALLNLALNAMQAMEPGGRLTLASERTDDDELGPCIALVVQDTGRGIPREMIERIHEPFTTTRRDGTGLGLFITNKIITAHGGRLDARSREGRGSTLTVLLPEPAE